MLINVRRKSFSENVMPVSLVTFSAHHGMLISGSFGSLLEGNSHRFVELLLLIKISFTGSDIGNECSSQFLVSSATNVRPMVSRSFTCMRAASFFRSWDSLRHSFEITSMDLWLKPFTPFRLSYQLRFFHDCTLPLHISAYRVQGYSLAPLANVESIEFSILD